MAESAIKTGTITVNPDATTTSVTKLGQIVINPSVGGQTLTKTGQIIINPAAQQVVKLGQITINPIGATISAGPNRTVEADEIFALTLVTESPAPGTTIASRTWKLAGATVPPLQRAPITRLGAALTYTCTAVDNLGNSASTSLVITVRPANLRTGGGRPLVKRTGS